jgi:hypothetical protein
MPPVAPEASFCAIRARRGRHAVRTIELLALLILLGGCATTPAPALPPELELLDAARLELPAGCDPDGGRVYRTRFVVRPDGRVEGVVADADGGCIGEALREWVATFRYRPPGRPVTSVVDWLGVTARRGG